MTAAARHHHRQLGSTGPSVFPLLADSLGALQVALSSAELGRIEAAMPTSTVAGTRYAEQQMRMLDSER